MEHRFRCCICKKTFTGYGNNPWPLKDKGKCCNSCNDDVTMARLALMIGGKEKDEELLRKRKSQKSQNV